MHVTDFGSLGAVAFAGRLFGAFDQPSIGDKVLDCGEAVDLMNFVEDD